MKKQHKEGNNLRFGKTCCIFSAFYADIYIHHKSVIISNFIIIMLNGYMSRTDFGAGCVKLRIRSAEPPGEHRYEN